MASPPPDSASPGREPVPALDPAVLLIDAKELARQLSISTRSLHRLVATSSIPKPVRLGTRSLWRVEEIEEWVRDACPPLESWERQPRLPLRPPAKPP